MAGLRINANVRYYSAMFKVYPFRRTVPHVEPLGAHLEGQAFVLTQGTIRFTVPGRTWLLPPGRLCWIPPHMPHGFVSRAAVEGISLKAIVPEGLPIEARLLKRDPFHLALLQRLLARREDAGLLLPVLYQAIAHDAAEELILPMPADARLTLATETLLADAADTRSVARVAASSNLSERTFMRLFARETGMSFGAWRTRLRVISAAEHMEAGATATQAAYLSGFCDSSALSRAFRNETGLTPTQYITARRNSGLSSAQD